MATDAERTQRRHVRDKATIDHLAHDVYQLQAANQQPTVRSPRTPPACPSRSRSARNGIRQRWADFRPFSDNDSRTLCSYSPGADRARSIQVKVAGSGAK
jgi:hypothetical protein